MAVPFPPELKGIPTIFGEVLEKNVTFCIDTSGSMYKGLDVVKEHLIETLLKHASKPQPRSFNLVEFNSDVIQWADKMVKCSPQTVAVAADWIQKLAPKTGTNTEGALLTALADTACGSVYIVTDGLADQHPVDILDSVYNAARGRPIHCIYLSSEEHIDSVAVELLEDLAVESYGSFHIITLTTHGSVERITPIYRADHAQERLVRTASGTMHSPNKMCSVTTALAVEPEESLYLTQRVNAFGYNAPYFEPMCPPPYGCGDPLWRPWYGNPYRYYYPYGWSRYRPARNYLKAKDAMIESIENTTLSPAAGALLIGKRVLARRMDDGYFYLGTVKSQILADKFLIAFGPCKHGKYKDTTYQDTYVYDIIDYEDAKRHTILCADRVLASWEPEGERFAPGVVIDGHEKRTAPGPEDEELTVTFSNGKTAKVLLETAIWTPTPVYERLSLELKMPKEAREKLQGQEDYPQESLPGYPTSGPVAHPEEFGKAPPFEFDIEPMVLETRPWLRPYLPPGPMIAQTGRMMSQRLTQSTKSAVQSEEISKLVPGTTLTNGELNQKISMQLNEHKQLLDEQEKEKTEKDQEEYLLSRRKEEIEMKLREREIEEKLIKEEQERQIKEAERRREEEERCHFLEELRRKEEESKGQRNSTGTEEIEERLCKQKLSEAYESWQAAEGEWEKELERERLEHLARLEEIEKLRELGGDRLLKKRQKQEENMFKKSVSFSEKPSPLQRPLSASVVRPDYRDESSFDYGQFAVDDMDMSRRSRLGLHRRSRKRSPQRPPWKKYWKNEPAPENIEPNSHGAFRETALQCPLEARDQRGPYINEWRSPMYKYVDNYATHDYSNSVAQLMVHPQPPPVSKTRVEPCRPPRHPTVEEKEERRRDFRRQQVMRRQQAWDKRLKQEDSMKDLMQDHHRDRILAQLERDNQRQLKEQETVEKAREAKKHISAEIRATIEANQQKEKVKEDMRIEAMRQRRERREAIQSQHSRQVEEIEQKRQVVKEQNSQARWNAHHQRLINEDIENQNQEGRFRNAKVTRIQHFRNLETEAQMRKDCRIGVTNQHLAMYRSQVLP